MRTHRLRPRSSFQHVYHQGKSAANRLLVVYVGAGPEKASPPQVAVVAGKRLGNAVIRNRVRRQLREIVRSVRGRLRPGLRVIVVARKGALEAGYWQLRKASEELLQTVGGLQNDNVGGELGS